MQKKPREVAEASGAADRTANLTPVSIPAAPLTNRQHSTFSDARDPILTRVNGQKLTDAF